MSCPGRLRNSNGKSYEILKKSGYAENRSVDITAILAMYSEYNYPVNEIQKAFLEKFSYLDIWYLHPKWGEAMSLSLDPVCAEKSIDPAVIEEYNNFLNEHLLIIGEIERENIALFLSDQGVFYGGVDDIMIKWGNDFIEMLEMLVSGKRGEISIIG